MRNYLLEQAEREVQLYTGPNILYVSREDGLEGKLSEFQTILLRGGNVRIELIDYDPGPEGTAQYTSSVFRQAA